MIVAMNSNPNHLQAVDNNVIIKSAMRLTLQADAMSLGNPTWEDRRASPS